MGKKLTLDFVRSKFLESGYELLAQEYLNSKSKLLYKCPKNHTHQMTYYSFQQGVRCPSCFGANAQRHNSEFITSEFRKVGYKPLFTEYENAHKKFMCRCSKNHIYETSYNNFSQGRRCPSCFGNEAKRHNLEFVKSKFIAVGYTPIFTKYKNAFEKLLYCCDRGHKHEISYSNFDKGNRCPSCNIEKQRHTLEFVRSEFSAKGYTLLSNEYENCMTKLHYRCPEGHEHSMRYNDFKTGRRCGLCFPGGFNPNLPGTLYYLQFTNQGKSFYKIGITNHTVKARFSEESVPYKIIWQKRFDLGKQAYSFEQMILKLYRSVYGYKGTPFLISGNTELFVTDIFN